MGGEKTAHSRGCRGSSVFRERRVSEQEGDDVGDVGSADSGRRVPSVQRKSGGRVRWGHVQSLSGLAVWEVQGDMRVTDVTYDEGPHGLSPDGPSYGWAVCGGGLGGSAERESCQEHECPGGLFIQRGWQGGWTARTAWGPLPISQGLLEGTGQTLHFQFKMQRSEASQRSVEETQR